MNIRLVSGVASIVVGLVLVAFSLAVLLNFSATFKWILNKRVVLSERSQGFPIWKHVSNHFDTRFAWYFFNLTNPTEFKNGEMPILKEVGPFWYRVNLTKENVVFHENKSVSYEEHRRFEFDPVLSVLPENTLLTMINVPLMAAVTKGEGMNYFARLALSGTLSQMEEAQNATDVYTVNELTYGGRKSTLVTLANGIGALISDDDDKNRRFGFAVDKNMTNPAIINMYTGATGPNDLNRVYTVDGLHKLSMWPKNESNPANDQCNTVDGTLGNLRAPMNAITEERIFIPDMCHTVTTRYQKDIEWHNVRLRRFNLTIDNFYSRDTKPENFCYDEKFRLPSGVSEVGPCKKDAPILMSLPHFMDADASFRDKVKGLNPDVTKHEFTMDHEPTTGMTVRVRGRLQANLRVIPSSIVDDTSQFPEVILPLFWQEMLVEAGPTTAQFLKKVNSYPGLGKIALTIVALFGLIMAVIGAGLLITSFRSQKMESLSTKHKAVYSKAPTNEPSVDI